MKIYEYDVCKWFKDSYTTYSLTDGTNNVVHDGAIFELCII